MPDVIPTECYNAWVMRLNLYQVAEQCPEKDPEYQTALLNLQNHFNDCQQCKDYLRYYAGLAVLQPMGGE